MKEDMKNDFARELEVKYPWWIRILDWLFPADLREKP